uniref:Uncharacterized protein n=1 Tax=Hippocampus comes TaxID=109280 RepID=A0A3Q2Y4A5_HIPCM
MPSMDSPFSNFFSISTISLTPRSALEMSNTPPTEAVWSPASDRPGWQICIELIAIEIYCDFWAENHNNSSKTQINIQYPFP